MDPLILTNEVRTIIALLFAVPVIVMLIYFIENVEKIFDKRDENIRKYKEKKALSKSKNKK